MGTSTIKLFMRVTCPLMVWTWTVYNYFPYQFTLADTNDITPGNDTDDNKVISTQQRAKIENPVCFLGNNYCGRYLITPKDHCKGNVQIRLLALVLSGMSNFEERKIVRETWGSSTVFTATDLKVVFILGKGGNYIDLQAQLVKESDTYNDLVLADFRESDKNTTYKTLIGMQWVTRFCPNAQFILKTGNDVFINTFTFLDILRDMETRGKTVNIIRGYVWKKAEVRRTGKYQVSKAEYGAAYFPPYCAGSAYLMSRDVVSQLVELAIIDKSQHFLLMEDVYITGILAARARIKLVELNAMGWIFGPSKFEKARWKNYLVWMVALKPTEKQELWKTLLVLAGITKGVPTTTGLSTSSGSSSEIMVAGAKGVSAGVTRVKASRVVSIGKAGTLIHPPTDVPFTRQPECFIGRFCIDYLMKPKDHCKRGVDIRLVAFVLSRIENFARRQQVRETWGDRSLFHETELRVVFILGKGENFTNFEEKLKKESNTYNDLVVGDFKDSYENLTLKTLFGLHWTTHFCPNAQFVLKTDDDVLINTFQFLEILREMDTNKTNKNIIMGLLWENAKVWRTGKYQVSVDNYPHEHFPNYCGGAGYVMSKDTIPKLLNLAIDDRSPTLLRMEDVYVSGVLAEKAQIKPFMMTNKIAYVVRRRKFFEKRWRTYLVWHGTLNSQQELNMWETLTRLAAEDVL